MKNVLAIINLISFTVVLVVRVVTHCEEGG